MSGPLRLCRAAPCGPVPQPRRWCATLKPRLVPSTRPAFDSTLQPRLVPARGLALPRRRTIGSPQPATRVPGPMRSSTGRRPHTARRPVPAPTLAPTRRKGARQHGRAVLPSRPSAPPRDPAAGSWRRRHTDRSVSVLAPGVERRARRRRG